MEQWYNEIAHMLATLELNSTIDVLNHSHPKDIIVTEGVVVFYNGKEFSIWSDEPGELIIKYSGKFVDQIAQSIEVAWNEMQT